MCGIVTRQTADVEVGPSLFFAPELHELGGTTDTIF